MSESRAEARDHWRPLGRTGTLVSPLALGTATFGVAPGEREAARVVAAALDAGITLMDTADSYGNQARFDRPGAPAAADRASAEELLGHALSGRRDEAVVCTKVGEQSFPGPNGRGLGRAHVVAAVERSLRRLCTDRIDVLHVHHPDPATGVEEMLATFDGLIRSGKVLHWGLSTFAGWQVAEVLLRADAMGVPRPVVHQVRYSALHRGVEAEVLPACRNFALPVTAFSPLAGGLLADRTGIDAPVGAQRWKGPGPAASERRRAAAFAGLAAEAGLDRAQLALAWVLSRPGLTSAVVGPESTEQLLALAPAMTLEVPSDLLAAVDSALT